MHVKKSEVLDKIDALTGALHRLADAISSLSTHPSKGNSISAAPPKPLPKD